MKNIVFCIITLGLFAAASCSQERHQGKDAKPEDLSGRTAAAFFRFSQQAGITGKGTDGNWCYKYYPEAVLVSAPPDNSNRRFFDAQPGVYKMIVPFGKITASLILRSHGGSQPVVVFTSDHFPECLSNAANFSLSTDGASLLYDNRENIRFSMGAQPNGSAMRVFLDLPLGSEYGVEVRLCDNCAD